MARMKWLVPSLSWIGFRRVLAMACVGALLAGAFGVVHDQISYTLGPEYYERFKFDQFAYARMGLGGRWFVAVIGWLATWWVGFIGGWFVVRVGGAHQTWRTYVRSLAEMMAAAAFASALGAAIGPWWLGRSVEWSEALRAIQVTDAEAFNRVAGMHLGAYLGAAVAWMIVMVRGLMRSVPLRAWRNRPTAVRSSKDAT